MQQPLLSYFDAYTLIFQQKPIYHESTRPAYIYAYDQLHSLIYWHNFVPLI
jgi:hypothetical protein